MKNLELKKLQVNRGAIIMCEERDLLKQESASCASFAEKTSFNPSAELYNCPW
ncbi:MAG: hypothetical protein ACEPOW_06675 [Bacteroidales bacterium]